MSHPAPILWAGKGLIRSLALLAGSASLAAAQESMPVADDAARQQADPMGEVTVTGSRIARTGFTAPTPLTTLSVENLAATSPGTLPEALAALPAFHGSELPQNVGVGTTGSAGRSFLDLRGLGPARTLVLLDGKRVVPGTDRGSADAAIFPSALIDRIEVVTGGASAAYGSDAVSGVVNFIYDNDFEGIKGEMEVGQSEYGDADNYTATVAFGTSFAEGRGHLLASSEVYQHDGISDYLNRPWALERRALISNPDGPPDQIIVPDVNVSFGTFGGLITSGPLRGTQFGSGGVIEQHDYGTLTTSTTQVGGTPSNGGIYTNMFAALDRKSHFARASYDVTERLNAYVEVLYAESQTEYNGSLNNHVQGRQFTIFRENAFLPQAIRDQMVALNLNSFPLGRLNRDWGFIHVSMLNRTSRGLVGLDGSFGDGYTWNAYYTKGRHTKYHVTSNNQIIENSYRAADAIVDPLTGDIVCQSTLSDPNNGCVPINLFGDGVPSQEAIDYITGNAIADQDVDHEVAAVSIQGEPFSTWAGPVAIAAGVEYRKESTVSVTDPIAPTIKSCAGIRGCPSSIEGVVGGYQTTNLQPIRGGFDITEGFVEAVFPLAADAPWAKALDVNAAARYAEYSTSGGVTTWKVGTTWRPTASVMLRATRSRDIRAANLFELFAGFDQFQGNVRDPNFGGAQINFFGAERGNPLLEPEEADTTTAGIVYQPQWLQGFNASLDVFDIEIDGAVGRLDTQAIVDGCFQGEPALCALIGRNAQGQIATIETPFLNTDAMKTSGLDIELSYGFEALGGRWDLRTIATYTEELQTIFGQADPIEDVGQLGGKPQWAGTAWLSYRRGPLTLNYSERYVDAAVYDNTFVEGEDISRSDNRIASVRYSSLNANYAISAFGLDIETYATVSNLFDRKPPKNTGRRNNVGTTPTNYSIYDTVGRQYRLGVTFNF